MSGYDYRRGMSNNAVKAYDDGLVTASKVRGVPAELVRMYCEAEEWHHTSGWYNRTDFYDPDVVRAVFGLAPLDGVEMDEVAVEALEEYRRARRSAPTVYDDCVVEWLEWGGSRKHPTCWEMKENGCRVEVRGKTATVTLPSGRSFRKRLTTNGFSFRQSYVSPPREVSLTATLKIAVERPVFNYIQGEKR